MPKVEIEVLGTRTIDFRVTKEVDVPQSVLDNDELFEWLEKDGNKAIWQKPSPDEIEEEDETFELNEACVL